MKVMKTISLALALLLPINYALATQLPDHAAAMQDLFGATDPSGKIKTANKLTSFWFEQSFKNGDDNFHVIFFGNQALDEADQSDGTHAQGVGVSAITYKQNADQWQVVSKQTAFTEMGNYGVLPNDSEDKPITKAETLQLSPSIFTLMIYGSYSGSGESMAYKTLLAFSNNAWRDIGSVEVAAKCYHDYSDNDWSYKGGVISIVSGKNTEYPDLLVKYTGKGCDKDNDATVPTKSATFTFNGKKYIDPALPVVQ